MVWHVFPELLFKQFAAFGESLCFLAKACGFEGRCGRIKLPSYPSRSFVTLIIVYPSNDLLASGLMTSSHGKAEAERISRVGVTTPYPYSIALSAIPTETGASTGPRAESPSRSLWR
jgi:hypothetical protein